MGFLQFWFWVLFLEMNELDEQPVFEIALVLSKEEEKIEDEDIHDAWKVLVDELKKAGLLVETVPGLGHGFIKVRFSSFLS